MLSASQEQLAVVNDREGMEFYYAVRIYWPDGVKSYSQYKTEFTEPLLLEIADFRSSGRVDGFGEVNVTEVKLNDPYGVFRYRFDNYNFHSITAEIFLLCYQRPEFVFKLSSGRIRQPIVWYEGTRVLVFSIVTSTSEESITYVPSMDDVDQSSNGAFSQVYFDYEPAFKDNVVNTFISSSFFRSTERLNTNKWPDVYGQCARVPVKPLAINPECEVVKEVWDVTGGWAARYAAILANHKAREFNSINAFEIAADPPTQTAKPLVNIPAATGVLQIPVNRPDLFDQFEDIIVSLKKDDQIILALGSFTTLDESAERVGKEFVNGYFSVTVGPSANAFTVTPGSQEPTEGEPSLDNLPTTWPCNLNIPLYEDIRVFQDTADDIFETLPTDWPAAMTKEEKKNLIARSIKQRVLENTPDFLNPDPSRESAIAVGTDQYANEAYNKIHLVGYNRSKVPWPNNDYPWIENCWIEVEVPIEDIVTPLDPTLRVSADNKLAQITRWDQSKKVGYTYLPVIKQFGLECLIYNPNQFKFNVVKAVYRNDLWKRAWGDADRNKFTVFAADLLAAETWAKAGVIETGSKISLFYWQPAHTFIIDTKKNTNVLALKYQTEEGLLCFPEDSYQVVNVEQGSLWTGYHPEATAIVLSYSGMLRYQNAGGKGADTLYADTENIYNTDEAIIRSIVSRVNKKPTSWNIQPMIFGSTYKNVRANDLINSGDLSAKQLVANIAFQNGKIVRGNGTFFELVDMVNGAPSAFEFNESNIVAQTIALAVAGEPSTKFSIDFGGNYVRQIKKHNYYYGEKEISWRFNVYNNPKLADDVLNMWTEYYSNIWRVISFRATFAAVQVQVFDIVEFKFTEGLSYQPVYEEVTGPIDTPVIFEPTDDPEVFTTKPAPMPLYNTQGLITNIDYNVSDGTILFKAWLPILAGQTSSAPLIWRSGG